MWRPHSNVSLSLSLFLKSNYTRPVYSFVLLPPTMANLNSHFQPHLSPAQFELNRAGEKETLQEDKLKHEVLSSRKIKCMHEDWMNWKTRRNRCSLGRHSYEDVLMKIEDVCYGHKQKLEVWCYGADITRRTNEIQQNQASVRQKN